MLIPITIGTSDSLANSQPMLLPSQEYKRSQATSAERQSADCGRRSVLELENRDLSQKVI